MNESRILVVVAHPDDEVLGCGGTLARLTPTSEIRVLILGEGITSRVGLSEVEKQEGLNQLAHNNNAAAIALQITTPVILAFPDQRFDTVPLLEIIHVIEAAMVLLRPTMVLTHHAGDVNLDHRLTREAVEAAVRPASVPYMTAVLGFEIPSSSDWNFTRPRFAPNVFYALTDRHMTAKVQAMACYESETRLPPHPRSEQNLRALARMRGGQCGQAWAEGFELVYQRVL